MNAKTMIIFSRNGMGDAPPELQQKLAGTFLRLLAMDTPPGLLAFYGHGVQLVCEGSPVLEQLQALADKGVTIVVCQTCLDYLNLRSAVRVGVVGGMGDIVTAMGQAEKVISV